MRFDNRIVTGIFIGTVLGLHLLAGLFIGITIGLHYTSALSTFMPIFLVLGLLYLIRYVRVR